MGFFLITLLFIFVVAVALILTFLWGYRVAETRHRVRLSGNNERTVRALAVQNNWSYRDTIERMLKAYIPVHQKASERRWITFYRNRSGTIGSTEVLVKEGGDGVACVIRHMNQPDSPLNTQTETPDGFQQELENDGSWKDVLIKLRGYVD